MKKLTRKQLLQALGDCQSLFGEISAAAGDRNPHRAAQIEGLCRKGFDFCVDLLSTEPPITGSMIGEYDRRDFL